ILSPEGKPLVSNSESDHETMDRAIARLNEQKQAWADLPVGKKIKYLEQMRSNVERVADHWVSAATQAKGIPAGSPLAGEEWISGPYALIYALNCYVKTLRAIAKTGYPDLKPGQVRTRADGQVIVDVFPESIYDRLLLSGVSGEVWMQPGVTKDNLRETMGV